MKLSAIIVESFFDGFGPGGLFVRLKRPGAPTKVFASSDNEVILNEVKDFLQKAESENLHDVAVRSLREWMKERLASSQHASTGVSHSVSKG